MHPALKTGPVAIYARYSCDRQSERSVEDQIYTCRTMIEHRGGDPDRALIFADRAVSAASLDRDGFEQLMRAVAEGRVSAIVVEDVSRLSRDFADAAAFFRRVTYLRVRLLGVIDGIDSAAPNALYCAAYRNGNYIIRMFSAGKRVDVVGRPLAHEAVKKAETPKTPVVQEVGWTVKGDAVSCVINGTAVWTGTKADVTGAGKLPSTDGIVGIRVSHNSDALVTGFGVGR